MPSWTWSIEARSDAIRRRAEEPRVPVLRVVEVLPLPPEGDPAVRTGPDDGRAVVAVMAFVRVLDGGRLGLVVPDDRVPRDVMAAGRRLEERQQVVAPVEPVQERIDVLDVLGEAVADCGRVAVGPAGRRSIEQGLELVARHSVGLVVDPRSGNVRRRVCRSAWASACGSSGCASGPSAPARPRCPSRPTGRSPDSSASWPGRSASGTWMRFTRTRYQSDERPRIPSTRMSAGSRKATTSGWRAFQRSRPSSASAFDAAREISTTGIDRLPSAGRRGPGAFPFGRQAGVRVAGRHGGCAFRGDLRRRATAFAATRLVLGLRSPRLRRLDARRLAGLLGVVRRPGGVALTLGFVALAELAAAPPASRPRHRCPRRDRRSPRTGPARSGS